MPEPTFDSMLAQWRKLSPGDRKAVLKRLPMERRIELEHALSSFVGTEQGDTSSRVYRCYSPWLGKIVEAIDTGKLPDNPIKPAVADTVRAAHAVIGTQSGNRARPSLLDLIADVLKDWGLSR